MHYGTNHPQLKQCTRVILSLWLHTRAHTSSYALSTRIDCSLYFNSLTSVTANEPIHFFPCYLLSMNPGSLYMCHACDTRGPFKLYRGDLYRSSIATFQPISDINAAIATNMSLTNHGRHAYFE